MFSDIPGGGGQINFMKYEINVSDGVKPKSSVPYKIPLNLREEVKAQIDKWLEIGIIRKSTSEWTSPIVVVVNADGSVRITVDYRKINPHVYVDNFPMPRIDTVIERLSGAALISKVDLTKAFLQIPLTEESCKYTSFVTGFGQ